jgi:hypothetical protein
MTAGLEGAAAAEGCAAREKACNARRAHLCCELLLLMGARARAGAPGSGRAGRRAA